MEVRDGSEDKGKSLFQSKLYELVDQRIRTCKKVQGRSIPDDAAHAYLELIAALTHSDSPTADYDRKKFLDSGGTVVLLRYIEHPGALRTVTKKVLLHCSQLGSLTVSILSSTIVKRLLPQCLSGCVLSLEILKAVCRQAMDDPEMRQLSVADHEDRSVTVYKRRNLPAHVAEHLGHEDVIETVLRLMTAKSYIQISLEVSNRSI